MTTDLTEFDDMTGLTGEHCFFTDLCNVKQIKNSKKMKTRTLSFDFTYELSIDREAQELMAGLSGIVSHALIGLLNQQLLGFSNAMQYEMADYMLAFANEQIVNTTGSPSADSVLEACYAWIAADQSMLAVMDDDELFNS